MANHLFKTGYGQCKCRWCGRRGGDCRTTMEMRIALKRYAISGGRTWKAKLSADWERGGVSEMGYPIDPFLMQLRNIIGPSGLQKITPLMLERVKLEGSAE